MNDDRFHGLWECVHCPKMIVYVVGVLVFCKFELEYTASVSV